MKTRPGSWCSFPNGVIPNRGALYREGVFVAGGQKRQKKKSGCSLKCDHAKTDITTRVHVASSAYIGKQRHKNLWKDKLNCSPFPLVQELRHPVKDS